MSKAKHTPGPWTIMRQGSPRGFAVQRGREGGFLVCGKSSQREQADAHLIAAAPELLEALEAVMDGSEYGEIAQMPGTYCWKSRATPSHESLDKALAAIAKARGEA